MRYRKEEWENVLSDMLRVNCLPKARDIMHRHYIQKESLEDIGITHDATREKIRQIIDTTLTGLTHRFNALNEMGDGNNPFSINSMEDLATPCDSCNPKSVRHCATNELECKAFRKFLNQGDGKGRRYPWGHSDIGEDKQPLNFYERDKR
jgi:hypothetical protein